MKSVVRATAVLASSSVVSVAAGIASAKVWAVLVGPSGLGYLGLLQGMVGIGAMLAAMGLHTGVVRMGANALAQGEPRKADAYRRAALLWSWLLGGASVLLFLGLRGPLSQLMLGGGEHAAAAALMGLAVCLTVVSGLQVSVLNAHHRVSALARVNVAGSVLGAAVGLALLWRWREAAIPWTVLCNPLVSLLTATWLVRREVGPIGFRHTRAELREATRALFGFGVPYVGSMLVGSGVQLALPMLVLHFLDTESVGFFRAATSLTVGYVGFLLTAMAQDYYPRVSGAAHRPRELSRLINQQIRLVTLIGVPIILVAQVSTPFIVPLLYAESFAPTADILAWQWVGTVFKLWGWTLSFVILARCSSRKFFLIEAVGGTSLLLASVGGMRLFGLEGLGIGFLATTLVYGGAVWALVRREVGLTVDASNRILMGVALLLSITVGILPVLVSGVAPTYLAGLLAGAAVVASLRMLWGEIRLGDVVQPRLGTLHD